ncbi:MAG: cation diffusion facilitator family transporter [Thiotrichaceae bacterium]
MSHSHHHHHSHDATSKDTQNPSRYQEIKKVTLVGASINVMLALAQLLGGIFSQSQALIADGLHTLSDLASDFVVLIAAKLASKDADEDHPYGHGRIETVATIILGLSLAMVGVGIALDAFGRLAHPELLLNPKPWGLVFAALAIVSKEALYHYTKRTANRIHSPMLLANAWHHRSDAISSLVVLVGIAGAVFLEIKWLDAAAAIIVALMILYMGLQMIKESMMELVDTALDPDQVGKIHDYIEKIDGVKSVHMLRTRKMGGTALADVHVQVSSHISVSEGHHIAERVMNNLQSEFAILQDITVHIDPEDDETASPCEHLPSRQEILNTLYPSLSKLGVVSSDSIILHYLDGKISLSLCIDADLSAENLTEISKACTANTYINAVSIYTGRANTS